MIFKTSQVIGTYVPLSYSKISICKVRFRAASHLSGYCAPAVSLRMQVDPSIDEFKGLLPERAYADFVLCGCLLFLIVWNFMG